MNSFSHFIAEFYESNSVKCAVYQETACSKVASIQTVRVIFGTVLILILRLTRDIFMLFGLLFAQFMRTGGTCLHLFGFLYNLSTTTLCLIN